jgi:hypothetical protein
MTPEPDFIGLSRRFAALRAEPEYGQALERLVDRGAKGQAAGSALNFVLQAVRPRPPMTGTRVDPVAAAFALWGREGSADQLTQAVAAGRRRLGEAVAQSDVAAEASEARALAVLSPHGDLPRLLVQSERAGGLAAYAEQLTLALDDAEWPECPRAPFSLEAVSNAGLAAEWLTMAALALGDSNLTLVARRAEAWRQTVAGRWRYGAAPRGWRALPGLDEVTLATAWRIAARLRSAPAARPGWSGAGA